MSLRETKTDRRSANWMANWMANRMVSLALFVAACAPLVACDGAHEHGHHDGGDHEHGGHEHAGPEPVAITRWTDGHELFVEFDPPRPNRSVDYHAHVTTLAGFEAVTAGSFTVRYYQEGKVIGEASVHSVLRAGIFAPSGPAPVAGTYDLKMIFEAGKQRAEFDCGTIDVGEQAPAAEDEDAAELPFGKEQQWSIPFATTWVERRPMAREIELPAVVESPGVDQLTIASPTGGRFYHREKVALAEGIVLKKGTVIGHVAPTVAGDDFSRLQLAVEEAKLERDRARREKKRIHALVAEGVIARKRLIEVEAQIASASARLKSARRRVGQVVSPGAGGGIEIKATRSGTIARVLIDNGAPVAPGQPLVQLVGRGAMWSKARFVSRPGRDLAGARPVALRVGGRRVLLGDDAAFLSRLPIVDQSTQLASWTAKLGPLPRSPDTPPIRPGVVAVMLVRVGTAIERIAVPEAAVIEINTHAFVFVQVSGESFHKRRVAIGVRDGGFVEVISGVQAGERVVTRGGFDIHLAAVMGNVASHRH